MEGIHSTSSCRTTVTRTATTKATTTIEFLSLFMTMFTTATTTAHTTTTHTILTTPPNKIEAATSFSEFLKMVRIVMIKK